MSTFAQAVQTQPQRTTNGMQAHAATNSACVDFFYQAGAMRGKDISQLFAGAVRENHNYALRLAGWLRDVRGGAGERELFLQCINWLQYNGELGAAARLLRKAPEWGRWSDVAHFVHLLHPMMPFALDMIGKALQADDALCAKWMPRKGIQAVAIREYLGLQPKQYRKLLVGLTKVVETQMCAKDWDNINFSQVPSVAMARYKSAFHRNTTKFAEYVQQLVNGEKGVKVNAEAVFPYDVIKNLLNQSGYQQLTRAERDLVVQQWAALPNYVGEASILPLVDVSGSMSIPAAKSTVTCMDIAVGLGLYVADKNQGAFKDVFLTFTAKPELVKLTGDIVTKVNKMSRSNWGMNTNLVAALDKILEVAKVGKVPDHEMPKVLLILSDMQFDQCVEYDDSAFSAVQRRFSNAGYTVPKVVFWNLNHSGTVPVQEHQSGAALVSGFSPSIMKALLAADLSDFTPERVMLKTIMQPRYDC